MSDKTSTLVDFNAVWAVLFAFYMFWLHSGWYRVDCALGVQTACELIAAEDEYVEARQ